jgi:hypothetical protein
MMLALGIMVLNIAPATATPTPHPKPLTYAQLQAELRRIDATVAAARHRTAMARLKAEEAHAKLCALRAKRGDPPTYGPNGCDALRVQVVPTP